MNEKLKDLFSTCLEKMNLSEIASDLTIDSFIIHLEELKRWNRKINLTSLEEDIDIIIKHFCDSLVLFPFMSPHIDVLDIGSGSGFPGLPLKVSEPTIKMTMIDSRRKRVNFLKHVIRLLTLKDIEVINCRAETKSEGFPLSKKYDLLISRAALPIHAFSELSARFLSEGGRAISMGVIRQTESFLNEVERHDCLTFLEVHDYTLPIFQLKRRLFILQRNSF